jgi:hypothetical protein
MKQMNPRLRVAMQRKNASETVNSFLMMRVVSSPLEALELYFCHSH